MELQVMRYVKMFLGHTLPLFTQIAVIRLQTWESTGMLECGQTISS